MLITIINESYWLLVTSCLLIQRVTWNQEPVTSNQQHSFR